MNTFAFITDSMLLQLLLSLREAVRREARDLAKQWLTGSQRHTLWFSAANLAVYLAIRKNDLTAISAQLNLRGLAAPGSNKISAAAELDAIISALAILCGQSGGGLRRRSESFYLRGTSLLDHNTFAIFGPRPAGRRSHIMATLPIKAAEDYQYVKGLIQSGITVARINCAYDSADVWEAMIANIRRAESDTGSSCRVLMDLCGPKARLTAVLLTKADGRLQRGDQVLLARSLAGNSQGLVAVTCSLPNYLDSLSVGDLVIIDEGKIEATVKQLTPEGVIIKISHTSPQGCRIKPHKGVNFPGKIFAVATLTNKDRHDLEFILAKADMVGSSFIRTADDITVLQREMARINCCRAASLPIVAKIETAQAIDNLPGIIFQAAQRQPVCLMIARGDLAVELGYNRLAGLQEQILAVAKAAHVPVIWATQVLDNLVKTGTPARAEISDALLAARAECVMLNKGAFLTEAVVFLAQFLADQR